MLSVCYCRSSIGCFRLIPKCSLAGVLSSLFPSPGLAVGWVHCQGQVPLVTTLVWKELEPLSFHSLPTDGCLCLCDRDGASGIPASAWASHSPGPHGRVSEVQLNPWEQFGVLERELAVVYATGIVTVFLRLGSVVSVGLGSR